MTGTTVISDVGMRAMPEDAVTNGGGKRQRLAQRRKAVGLTQEALARLLAVERSTIVRWERGETTPQPWTRPKLARALQVPADRVEELLATGGAGPDGRGPGGPASRGSGAAPRQLPAAVPNFNGRTAELETLTQVLDNASAGGPGAVVISAIGGTAGVGKTALAVHWAHRVAARFPDGQLYVNLRGYDPGEPMTPADALAGFLRDLGVSGQDIPAGEAQRAARYRSLLAGRRVLVILDNAGSAEQVRPLLPGAGSCCAVVTSRDALAGLVAREGATRLDLDLLPLADAIALLRDLIGERARADPDAVATLAGQCCRLPLALRVAAELAAARPQAPLAALVGELACQQRRLGLLDAGGDPRTAVGAVFSWSYRRLDPAAARAFRLAGLHPGADLTPFAVAALTGTALNDGRGALDVLARAHLIQMTEPGRYAMHDLLRAYARQLAAAHDGEDGQHAALTRLFDHYLHTAAAALDALHPADRHRRPRSPAPATLLPPVTRPDVARAWLDAERATLVAVTAHAAADGWPAHATRLADTLYRYFVSGGHNPEAITINTHARDAARRAGDRAAEATALHDLAVFHWNQGHYQRAIRDQRKALDLSRQAGNRAGQAQGLMSLGVSYSYQGHYKAATSFFEQALSLYRQIDDRAGEARTLLNLGLVEERQGRYQQAACHHRQSLAIAQETGALVTECISRINLGVVALRRGRYQQAAGHLDRALTLCRESGYRLAQADALTTIGVLRLHQGHPQEASSYLQESLALYREMGNRPGEADALNGLGEIQLANGQPGHARTQHTAALALASQIGGKYQQARAYHGLGNAEHTGGNIGKARRHWNQALALHTSLGTPEAGQIQAQLTATEDRT
jgi:tetratricopeptide (TPR) repeat protein/DNA-binding XRE family transcriptional regulator